MAIEQRFCINHPQRPAIGVCVITRKPICEECSTRYEGVNYSKEGLAILQQQRAKSASRGAGGAVGAVLGWVLTPILLALVYYGCLASAELVTTLLH